MDYRPQSPDLSSYAPRSPDLSGLGGGLQPQHSHHGRFGGAFGGGGNFGAQQSYSPTSIPQQQQAQYNYNHHQSLSMAPRQSFKDEDEDDDYLPDAPAAKRSRKGPQQTPRLNGSQQQTAGGDPTLGVALKTSFPVARIKRIMQADEDIGKVAQVTPHVVSRALELFMIKLIAASAQQAKGNVGTAGGSGSSKGPKKILAQHMKKAIQAHENFDFLGEIADKVPDAPSKAAKKEGSDSEEAKPKKKAGGGRRKKEPADD